jgi:cell division transport system permease protein
VFTDSQIRYLGREAVRSFRLLKGVSIISTLIMSVALMMLALFALLTVNLQALARTFQKEIEIIAFLEDGRGADAVGELQQRLLEQDGVESVSYVSKEEAMQEFRAQLGPDSDLVEVLDENPLPASLRLRLAEGARTSDKLARLAAWMRAIPGIEEVRYGDQWVQRLERYVQVFLLLDVLVGAIVLVSALFVVSNTVRLTVLARERSIEIMRLVGATDWFIRTPFLVEGALQGAAAAGLAMAVLWAVHRYAMRYVGPLIFYDGAQIAGFVALFAIPGGVRGAAAGGTWLCLALALLAPARAQESAPARADVQSPAADSLRALQRAAARDSLALYEHEIEAQETHLRDLRRQIRDLRRRDQELKKEEVGTLEQLKILDQEVALSGDLLRRLEAKQRRLEAQLDGIRAEHGRAREILVERKERLARTLRAMYVHGSANAADVLLRTTSLRDALTRFKYLGLLARNNERLLLDIRQQEAYLARTSAQLTQNLAEVSATAVETQEERQRLDESRGLRRTTLRRVRQQLGAHQRMIADLAASEKQLQEVIATLEKRRSDLLGSEVPDFPEAGFRALRGRMPWPAAGPVTTRFGRRLHPKYGTVTFNSGIDIAASEGDPVRSVARGRVEYVAWRDGYGRTVIVHHGAGFYTVYAHLGEVLVEEKQEVEQGGVLGRVGDTGSLDGPKLHFEIRSQAEAQDPLLWLRQP